MRNSALFVLRSAVSSVEVLYGRRTLPIEAEIIGLLRNLPLWPFSGNEDEVTTGARLPIRILNSTLLSFGGSEADVA